MVYKALEIGSCHALYTQCMKGVAMKWAVAAGKSINDAIAGYMK